MTFIAAYLVVASLIYGLMLRAHRDERIIDPSTLAGLAAASLLWLPVSVVMISVWIGLALLALLAHASLKLS